MPLLEAMASLGLSWMIPTNSPSTKSMSLYFPAAPWPVSLKLVSALGSVALLAAGFAAYRAIPVPTGFIHQFGLAVACVPIALLAGSLGFIVRGYEVKVTDLYIERLFTSTRIPLAGLSRVWLEPKVCKGSLRVFGNGGLFSFTGLYYNKKLGRYRLFATDFSHAVVLVLPQRVVVVTPANPQTFIDHLKHRFPGVETNPLARDG